MPPTRCRRLDARQTRCCRLDARLIFHIKLRPRGCRKKDDGNGVTGKEEKREAEEKISGCSVEDIEEVDAREKDIENKTL